MHFSIPDTNTDQDSAGASFTVFNLHINGAYHCSVRYRQLHSFHDQIKKEFGSLPNFPPKKILSLTAGQLEERRVQLEKYIQTLSQNIEVSGSTTFNNFLLQAQQESQSEAVENVCIDMYLMNGNKLSLSIVSTDQTDSVLETAAQQMSLPEDLTYYFGLYLLRKEDVGEHSIVRKLQEFESPYISLRAANKANPHRIVIRKSYWESGFDEDVLDNRVALNLLYVQILSDVERGWTLANTDQHAQLQALQQRGSKKEYVRLARTLKFYGFLQFHPCISDYPQPGSRVLVSAGNRELHLRVQDKHAGEAAFRVTRMRCWRISTTIQDENSDVINPAPRLDLSFEYLVAKDTLKWVTISSDQAILMSMCLQGMVDEVMMQKQGQRMKKPQDRRRDVKNSTPSYSKQNTATSPTTPGQEKVSLFGQRNLNARTPTSPTTSGAFIENDAFRDIGDDDL